MCKTIRGMEKVEKEKAYPTLSHNTRTRGPPERLNVERFRTDKSKVLLHTVRSKLWKLLLKQALVATNWGGFKRGLDK